MKIPSQKKLVKEEKVLENWWLSREESAAARRGMCQREVLLVTQSQILHHTLTSLPPQQLWLHKLG